MTQNTDQLMAVVKITMHIYLPQNSIYRFD